ncbi:MAG: hypothetical protein ACE5IR_26655 [bacterium]
MNRAVEESSKDMIKDEAIEHAILHGKIIESCLPTFTQVDDAHSMKEKGKLE